MRRLFWTLPFLAFLALASPASAGGPPAPDGVIKKAGGVYKGVGENDPLFTNVSAAQTVVKKVPPGGVAVFKAKAENTNDAIRDLSFVGSGRHKCCPGFKPRYFVGSENVTTAAVTGDLDFDDIAPGASTPTIRIEATIKDFVDPDTTFFAPVAFYDAAGGDQSDDNLEYRVKVI